ncbi:hypothetical protein Trydic_g12468 [Trypoxylus dichotomus]
MRRDTATRTKRKVEPNVVLRLPTLISLFVMLNFPFYPVTAVAAIRSEEAVGAVTAAVFRSYLFAQRRRLDRRVFADRFPAHPDRTPTDP